MRPSDLGAALAATVAEEMTAQGRETVAEGISSTLGKVLHSPPPVDTGRFRGSFVPFAGAPVEDGGAPDNQPFYPIPGDDIVDRVMDGWELGQDAGLSNDVPYARKLARDGHSPTWPPGTWDRIVAEVEEGV